MKDEHKKTKEQLVRELAEARQRIGELESAEGDHDQMEQLRGHLENTENILFTLANIVEVKDGYSNLHLINMSQLSGKLARRIGLSPSEQGMVHYGVILHDIGKVGISDTILSKPGPLSLEEYENVKQHAVLGDQLVRPMRSGDHVGPIVRGHHERWDGHGYPDGLAGETIPIGARIVSLCDFFDAMTSRRPYRAPLSEAVAIGGLRENSGAKFDPELVEAFLADLSDRSGNNP